MSELRVNYEKARVRPTTHDMGINSEDPTFFNQSVVGVEGINITTMTWLSAANVRNLELLAQIEERAAEDDLAINQLAQNRRKRKRRAYRGFWVRGGVSTGGDSRTAASLFSFLCSVCHVWWNMMTKIKTHYLPFYMIATTPRNLRQCRGHVE